MSSTMRSVKGNCTFDQKKVKRIKALFWIISMEMIGEISLFGKMKGKVVCIEHEHQQCSISASRLCLEMGTPELLSPIAAAMQLRM